MIGTLTPATLSDLYALEPLSAVIMEVPVRQDAPRSSVLAFFDIDDSFSSLTQLRSSALTTTCTLRPQQADLKQCQGRHQSIHIAMST